jgi:Rieske Fe-S protein
MSDERDPREGRPDNTLPSVEQVARLDAYLDQLTGERRPEPRDLSEQEARERLLAAQLRLAREGVEAPTPAFLQALEREVGRAVAQEARRRPRPNLSRGRFLRTIAAVAGGAGAGIAAAEGVAIVREAQRPHELVADGNGRWYDIAAAGEVSPGGVKSFSAGGVLGFLLNDGGRLHAVSAICTHMGCRLKPSGAAELHCLCHGSRFSRQGEVLRGLAPTALPAIEVRELNGRVYALGTLETV